MDNMTLEKVSVFLPKLGESITTATVVKWLKKKGDPVSLDEPLLEVSTDKVNSEIPAPVSGYLEDIFALEDQEKEVGELLCIIATKKPKAIDPSLKQDQNNPLISDSKSQQQPNLFLSPAVLRLAKEFNISMSDLSKMNPTGQSGRLTKQDVENFIHGKSTLKEEKQNCPLQTKKMEDLTVEKLKMSPVRKAIAENMAKSFYSAPHASLVTEVDMTKISKYIKKEKENVLKEHQVKLTVTAFIAYAIAQAIEQYPLINSTLAEDLIMIKKQVNLGIAVSVDQAVLVPVIKNIHTLNVIDIAKNIQDLGLKAKMHHLEPKDVKEGTVTLTNFGMSGTLIGIPIIRYPEVAIVGVGAMTKKVAVLENDSFGIRETLYLSLTFDHRVLDGMYGCGFLAEIKRILEESTWE